MTRLLESIQTTQRTNRGVFFDWPRDQIPEGGMADGQNVEPRGDTPEFGRIGKAPGWAKYSGTAAPGTGPIMDFREYIVAAGTRKVMAVTTTRASAYNATTNVFDDVTAGANLLTATAIVPIFTATLNDLFVVGDENDAPRKYDGTTWGLLGGSPPTCVGWDVYEGHLLGWATTAVKYRVQWSQLNDPEIWTPAAGQEQGSLDLRDHNLLGTLAGAKLGRHFIIYKEQLGGAYALTYVGLPLVMVQELMIPSFGVFSPRGVMAHGNVHYVMGSDEKLYAVTLGGKEEIAQGIRRRLYARLNWNKRRAAFVTVNPMRDLIMFCIPTGASAVADRAYLYNYRTGACGEMEFPFACGTPIRDPETTTINDLTGTIDALTGRIDELSGVGKDIFFMGGEEAAPFAYKVFGEMKDTSSMASWVVGRSFGSGDGRSLRIRGIEVDGSNQGNIFVDIGTADGPGEIMTFSPLGFVSKENRNRADGNISGRWIVGRFGNDWASDQSTWEVTGYRYDAYPVGRR